MRVPNLQQIEAKEGGIVKKFKLQGSLAGSNYVLFDHEGRINRYADEEEIVRAWFALRSQLYERRKEYMLARLRKECETLSNRARFVKAVVDGEVIIAGKRRQAIANQLRAQNFATQSALDQI